MKNLFIIACLALGLSSCCQCRQYEKKNGVELEKTVWQLTQLDGKPFKAAEESFTLSFEDGKFNGRGACNSIFGDAKPQKESGGKIRFTNIGSTRMMCPDQETEDRFINILSITDSFTKEGPYIYLFSDGEMHAVLTAVGK